MPPTLRWLGLALLGILIAAGVSIAASSLASQQIGLASQPIGAGDALAPAAREKPRAHRHVRGHRAGRPPTNAPTPAPAEPLEPSSEPEAPVSSAPPTTTESESAGPDGEHSGGADD